MVISELSYTYIYIYIYIYKNTWLYVDIKKKWLYVDIYKNTWIDLIRRRMKVFDPYGSFPVAANCVECILVSLSNCSKFVAMSWVKTISNAWTTTHRMHEQQLWTCVFGCVGCDDSTSHYLSCPLLLSLVHEICSTPFGPSVAHRLGLIEPNPRHIHLLSICFSIYHILKGQFKHTIMEAFRRQRFSEVHHQARKIGIDSFHSYERFFVPRDDNSDGPACKKPGVAISITNDAQHENRISRRMPPHVPFSLRRDSSSHSALLDARFAALRADPSLSEVAPGVFSTAIDRKLG